MYEVELIRVGIMRDTLIDTVVGERVTDTRTGFGLRCGLLFVHILLLGSL